MQEKVVGILDLGEPVTWPAKFRDRLRGVALLGVFTIALLVTLLIAPPAVGEIKIGATAWGLARLGMGGFVGYWIDRLLFPYARPHTLDGNMAVWSWIRRAIIVAACILAVGMIA
jgi:hypothetical protein